MKRIVSLWLPHWQTDLSRRRSRGGRPDKPVERLVLIEEAAGTTRLAAVCAAAAWGDAFFKGGRTSCIIGIGNAPSVRVAEKAGFTRAGTAQYHGEEVMLFYRN